MKVIKAIYNFIVGDMVILIGVALAVTVLALINNVAVLAPLKGFSGPFLVIAVLASLVATLHTLTGQRCSNPMSALRRMYCQ